MNSIKTIPGINKTIIWVDSNSIEESIQLHITGQAEIVGVSPSLGFELPDLSFLKRYPMIQQLYIGDSKQLELSGIYSLAELKVLNLSGKSIQPIDFAAFTSLKKLVLNDWHKGVSNLDKLTQLESLHLWGFKPKPQNIEEFAALKMLKELKLYQSNAKTLSGIAKLANLEKLALYYMRSLSDVSELLKLELSSLEFDNCKKLDCKDVLPNLSSLTELKISDCGSIKDINFLPQLPKLESFVFVGTKIESGDLSPCLNHPCLSYVGSDSKKTYSHSFDEINALLQCKKAP